jgi:hypothetical protein
LETGGQAGGIQAGGIQAGGAQAGGAQAGGGQAGGGQAGGVQAGGVQAGGFDYDELARRLLVQVARRLAATEPEAGRGDSSALQETVTGLEYELATAWTKHGKLAEENIRLREELRAAQRSLALAAERAGKLPVTTDLDSSEVVLLQRLLSAGDSDGSRPGGPGHSSPGGSGRHGSGSSGHHGSGSSDGDAEGLEDARSLLS